MMFLAKPKCTILMLNAAFLLWSASASATESDTFRTCTEDFCVIHNALLSAHHGLIKQAWESDSRSDCIDAISETFEDHFSAAEANEKFSAQRKASRIYCNRYRKYHIHQIQGSALTDSLVLGCQNSSSRQVASDCLFLTESLTASLDSSVHNQLVSWGNHLASLLMEIEESEAYALIKKQLTFRSNGPFDIYAVPYAGAFSAYATSSFGFLSGTEPEMQGSASAEFAIHEMMHVRWTDRFNQHIAIPSGVDCDVSVSDMEHAFIFVLSGIVTQLALVESVYSHSASFRSSGILHRLLGENVNENELEQIVRNDLSNETLIDNGFERFSDSVCRCERIHGSTDGSVGSSRECF